jgi:hypothetical protein
LRHSVFCAGSDSARALHGIELFRKIVAQADYVRTEGVRRTLREIAQADFNSFVKKPVQSTRLRR